VQEVLRAACRQEGLDADGAELLRLGENAIFRLRDPIVIRIARSDNRMPRVEKELCIAKWLAEAGIPAVEVLQRKMQPLLVNDLPVTFWRAVDGDGPTPSFHDLAALLRCFHAAGSCPCNLPGFDPLEPVKQRLEAAKGVKDEDQAFLQARYEECSRRLPEMQFVLPLGPIHGDAHTGNLLADRGQVVLLDFESAAYGPREWDLMPTAIAVDRYGLAEEKYQDFAVTYGFDVRGWDGYKALREVRELTMTTWLMQNIRESADAATEFRLRVNSLREGDFEREWNFF
jgi:Ser/Thr protein kinase RdoA (MazF antagonist)